MREGDGGGLHLDHSPHSGDGEVGEGEQSQGRGGGREWDNNNHYDNNDNHHHDNYSDRVITPLKNPARRAGGTKPEAFGTDF